MRDQLVDVPVERAVKLAIEIVEVPGFPHLAGLVAGVLQREPLHRVLDERTAFDAVDLEVVRHRVCVRRVVAADQAADRTVRELKQRSTPW